MIIIFKKGDQRDCGNYQGISLLSIPSKVMVRTLLNRINHNIKTTIPPETQCGFRAERSTVDMIFTLKQVQEIVENSRDLCSCVHKLQHC